MKRIVQSIFHYWPICVFLILEGLLFVTNYTPHTFVVGWDNMYPELNFWLNIKRAFFINIILQPFRCFICRLKSSWYILPFSLGLSAAFSNILKVGPNNTYSYLPFFLLYLLRKHMFLRYFSFISWLWA